jgi:hypothetical protein
MKKTFLFSLGIIAIFSSCSTTMYVPNTVNAPLLKEKKEVKINIDQNNLQAATAISNHVGLMLNGFYKTYKNNNYQHEGGLAEIGLGYYKPMNQKHLVLEAFGGLGLGTVSKRENITNNSQTYTASLKANATRIFLQPEIGYSNKIVDIIFTPRFSFLKYNSFSSSNYTQQQLKEDYLDNGQLTSSVYIFAEPALTVRLGYKWIKLQVQYGLTTNISGGNIKYADNFSSIGLVVDIARWYND